MGNQQDGFSKILNDLPYLLFQPEPQVVVQGGKRLVQQQDPGIGDKNPGQGRALLLSAGQLMGKMISQLRQTEALHDGRGCGFPFLFVRLPAEARPDVLGNRHIGKQGIILKHQSCMPLLGCQIDLFLRVK